MIDFAAAFGRPGVLGPDVGLHGDDVVRVPDHHGHRGGNGREDASINHRFHRRRRGGRGQSGGSRQEGALLEKTHGLAEAVVAASGEAAVIAPPTGLADLVALSRAAAVMGRRRGGRW